MSKTEKIKPCPFCGGDDLKYKFECPQMAVYNGVSVQCNSCKATGGQVTFNKYEYNKEDAEDNEADVLRKASLKWQRRTEPKSKMICENCKEELTGLCGACEDGFV